MSLHSETELSVGELDAMEARANAATPGRWAYDSYSTVWAPSLGPAYMDLPQSATDSELLALEPEVAQVPPHHGDTAVGRQASDAEFIAHAREDVPRLIAALRTRDAALVALREELKQVRDAAYQTEKDLLADLDKEIAQSKRIITELVARIDPDPNGCRCWDCLHARGVDVWWFHVCDKCGCKRCPHATNHIHDCTQSNLSGQPGSRFQ